MTDQSATDDQPPSEMDRVYDWWRQTQADRAAMARLRRCQSPLDALLVPATLSLLARLPHRQSGRSADRVVAMAAVLSHVRESEDHHRLARAIGRVSFGQKDSARLSEGRFRRLMQADTVSELQRAMTRLVRFMGGRANVRDLAETMLYWNDRTKRRWIFDYYAVGVATPSPAGRPTEPDSPSSHAA